MNSLPIFACRITTKVTQYPLKILFNTTDYDGKIATPESHLFTPSAVTKSIPQSCSMIGGISILRPKSKWMIDTRPGQAADTQHYNSCRMRIIITTPEKGSTTTMMSKRRVILCNQWAICFSDWGTKIEEAYKRCVLWSNRYLWVTVYDWILPPQCEIHIRDR